MPYGSSASYTGEEPTDTSLEQYQIYRLFDGWDKCTTFVKDHMKVNARYAQGIAPKAGEKTLAQMTPAELYACIRTGVLASNGGLNADPDNRDYYGLITSGDEMDITLGYDVDYDNVESVEIVPVGSKMVFDGTNYHNTGIKLFDEDKSWVLAVDFACTANESGAVLMSCCQGSNGMKMVCSPSPHLQYGGMTSGGYLANTTRREMAVIRHIEGDPKLYIYVSDVLETVALQTIYKTTGTIHQSTLTFGCQYEAVDGYASNFAKGIIYSAKLWYEDLGDDTCRRLACWTREVLTIQAAGKSEYNFRFQQISGGGGVYCACAFILKNLLHSQKAMHTSGSSKGGWPGCAMRRWLNSRVYDALPDGWKHIICLVSIKSGDPDLGNGEYHTSDDRLFSLAASEVGFAHYPHESNCSINFFTGNESRIKKLSNGNGLPNLWMLRSPLMSYTTIYHCVTVSGGISDSGAANTTNGVCFGFCIG